MMGLWEDFNFHTDNNSFSRLESELISRPASNPPQMPICPRTKPVDTRESDKIGSSRLAFCLSLIASLNAEDSRKWQSLIAHRQRPDRPKLTGLNPFSDQIGPQKEDHRGVEDW